MPQSLHRRSQKGFSLPEVIVTIAIVAIMAAIGIVAFGNVSDATRLVQAESTTAKLNSGLKGFCQGNWDIHTVKDDSATTDEFKVLRSLQYRPAAFSGRFDSGAPYFTPKWNPGVSAVTTDYRVRWNGINFELLVPGVAGKGLKLVFDASDQGADYVFPANYTPEPPAPGN